MPRMPSHPRPLRMTFALLPLAAVALAFPLGLGGCPRPDSDGSNTGVYRNTSDPTNAGATFVGSAACAACHAETAATAARHGHVHALQAVRGAAPRFDAASIAAGVPAPPPGFTWNDISYVIGGYTRGARFVNAAGFVLTDGTAGTLTQWNLSYPATGTLTGFAAFLPTQVTALPFAFEDFRRLTTGPRERTAQHPKSQDSRPGILGTWFESGVGCEACHGPGSRHVPNPGARDLFVGSRASDCGQCHTASSDPRTIPTADGYLHPYAQYSELLASGGHAGFNCTYCHDPHASTLHDRSAGIRNQCTACHTDATMAAHGGVVFRRGDYVEPVTCESCHMPFTGRSFAAASTAIVGSTGRMGDVRGHIFRIDPARATVADMLTADGSTVARDTAGRAGVSIDFACLRCHTTDNTVPNNAFPLTPDLAGQIAQNVHRLPRGNAAEFRR